jgi:hypothetical protein
MNLRYNTQSSTHLGEPRMEQYLRQRQPLGWIHTQHALQQVCDGAQHTNARKDVG